MILVMPNSLVLLLSKPSYFWLQACDCLLGRLYGVTKQKHEEESCVNFFFFGGNCVMAH